MRKIKSRASKKTTLTPPPAIVKKNRIAEPKDTALQKNPKVKIGSNEERLRRMATVVQDSNDAITIQDLDGGILAWNRGAEKIYGYSESEALGMNIIDIVPESHQAESISFIASLRSGELVSSLETKRKTKDGRVIDVWLTNTKLVDDQGKLTGVATTGRDITERTKNLEKLRRMATVIQDSNDAITFQDLDGNILAWNHGAELMYGYSEAEALTMNIVDTVPAEYQAEARGFFASLKLGKLVPTLETKRKTKDGRTLDVWLTNTKLTDDKGKLTGNATTERDITEGKHTEAYRIAEAKFRGLLETAPDAIVIVTEDGKIDVVNKMAESTFGYERSELIGQHMEILIPERFRQNHVGHQKRYSANPRARQMSASNELYGRRKDGTEFPIDVSLSPLKTESGMLISSAIRDITVRRASEKEKALILANLEKTKVELEQAVRVRDEFLSIASHELKTPLTAMKLQSYIKKRIVMSEGQVSPIAVEKLTKLFADTDKQIERITHLVDDMLDISRISSGKLTMSFEKIDLCEVVREIIERTTEQLKSVSCPITLEACESAFGVWDRFRIEQVILNLLTNAMRYGAGKPILVQVHATADGAQIIVADQGRGISVENHERIFQRFERAVSGSEISGLGLGLYISKQIVEAHLGSIRLESKLGQGAKFIVELPNGS